MNEFFKFLFDPNIQAKYLRPEWIKLYDYLFIDNTLLDNLKKNAEFYSDLIHSVYTRASGGLALVKPKQITTSENLDDESIQPEMTERQAKKIITIPQPFNLTKPKPKVFKEPIQMDNQFKIKYKLKLEDYHKNNLEKIEEQRKERLNSVRNVRFSKLKLSMF